MMVKEHDTSSKSLVSSSDSLVQNRKPSQRETVINAQNSNRKLLSQIEVKASTKNLMAAMVISESPGEKSKDYFSPNVRPTTEERKIAHSVAKTKREQKKIKLIRRMSSGVNFFLNQMKFKSVDDGGNEMPI